jgi:hypothetical protein
MDNPQLTRIIDCAWLAGFVDGEGCISLRAHWNGRRARKKYIVSVFEICNTQSELIYRCDEIARKLGVNMRIKEYHPKSTKKRPVWSISTYRLVKVKKLLQELLPYLVGKKQRATYTLRFINSRLGRCKEGHNQHKKILYSEEEIFLAGKVQELNRRGSSETIREALKEKR